MLFKNQDFLLRRAFSPKELLGGITLRVAKSSRKVEVFLNYGSRGRSASARLVLLTLVDTS